ncbi:MAG: hypothetical protein COB16_17430 [Rhodobacteraceae bacterium]|nr:MAG: hypothetical protein COB16_17430 [Paracoccaceae bacterium]
MNIIEPMVITDAELTASNIPENDYGDWSAVTTYGLGVKCISTTSHRIYESAQAGNLGNSPSTDDGTWWIELKATNKWSAFDNRRSNPATNDDEITYSITPTQDCDAIALFGLTAGTVRIEVYDGAISIYDQTFVALIQSLSRRHHAKCRPICCRVARATPGRIRAMRGSGQMLLWLQSTGASAPMPASNLSRKFWNPQGRVDLPNHSIFYPLKLGANPCLQ